jgi:hypothetical protein
MPAGPPPVNRDNGRGRRRFGRDPGRRDARALPGRGSRAAIHSGPGLTSGWARSMVRAKHDTEYEDGAMSSAETAEAVRQRLEGALTKLETAIDDHVRDDGEKIRRLRQELDAAHQENARLQQTSDRIAQRLETAIAKLKSVLER